MILEKIKVSEVLKEKIKYSFEVDWLLWQMGENSLDEMKPHHKVLSIFYWFLINNKLNLINHYSKNLIHYLEKPCSLPFSNFFQKNQLVIPENYLGFSYCSGLSEVVSFSDLVEILGCFEFLIDIYLLPLEKHLHTVIPSLHSSQKCWLQFGQK